MRRIPRLAAPLAVVVAAGASACTDWDQLSRDYEVAGVCATYLVAGDTHTCVRKADGALFCWGDNRFGQLGTGDKTSHESPTRVDFSGLGTLKVYAPAGTGEISADVAVFTCALASDNQFWCWGDNTFGQLGIGSTQSTPRPARVDGIAGSASKATNGGGHTCVQTNEGALFCWGANGRGQLGIGTTDSQSKPTQVKALGTRVGRLSTGGAHACVFTEDDGQVWCWGDNRSGQLGTGDTDRRLVPTAIDPSGLGQIRTNQLFAGGNHTCALRDDSTLWCWGGNRFGQLGTGDTNPRLAPSQVFADVAAAYVGGAHTCAIKTDGSVWCWGNNQYGQLGVQVGSQSLSPVQVLKPCQ